jgi:hypothetical protein
VLKLVIWIYITHVMIILEWDSVLSAYLTFSVCLYGIEFLFLITNILWKAEKIQLTIIDLSSVFFLYFGNGAGTRLIGKKCVILTKIGNFFNAFFQLQMRLDIMNIDS